jgi:Ca2+-binding EF-hand superfamily protein
MKMKKFILISSLMAASGLVAAQVDIITALDLDKDGRISLGEAAADKSLSDAFTTLDINEDGYLTADELEG